MDPQRLQPRSLHESVQYGLVEATAGNGASLSRAARTRRREAVAAEREVQAFRMRATFGYSFDEIADRLGMSKSGAWKAYRRQLTTIRELVDADEVREHVDLQLWRLDRVLGVAAAIVEESGFAPDVRLRAIDRVVRIEERRARLLGLDAPYRALVGVKPAEPTEVLTPQQQAAELDSWARMAQATIAMAQGPDDISPPPDA